MHADPNLRGQTERSLVELNAERTDRSDQQPTQAPKVILTVDQITIARDVKQRHIVGAGETFPYNVGSLWSLVTVQAQGGIARLEMRWWRGEQLVSDNPFVVSEGIRWREWSQVRVSPKQFGDWRVEVFYPQEQRILKTRTFKITPPSPHNSTPRTSDVINDVAPTTGQPISAEISKTLKSEQTSGASVSTPQSSQTPVIRRLEIARSIRHRRPVGISRRFKVKDERLWGYIEVSNLERPSHVWMEWRREDELRSKLKIRVGVSKRWRTWSWQRLTFNDVGRWEVRVISAEGDTLSQTHFLIDQ